MLGEILTTSTKTVIAREPKRPRQSPLLERFVSTRGRDSLLLRNHGSEFVAQPPPAVFLPVWDRRPRRSVKNTAEGGRATNMPQHQWLCFALCYVNCRQRRYELTVTAVSFPIGNRSGKG